MKRFSLLLLVALTPLFLGFNRKPAFTITFHSEGAETDMSKTMFPFELEGRRHLFKIVPEITQENITAFHQFPAESGNGSGVAFKLDFRGAGNLEIVTRTMQGQYLLAMVDGQPVDYVVVDKPVFDGIVTIWQGVPDKVIAAMAKKFPRMKGGKGPSAAPDMDMAPILKTEKKRALEEQRREEQEAKKPKKTKREELSEPQLPTNSASGKLPVEGGFNPYPTKPGEPALPKP